MSKRPPLAYVSHSTLARIRFRVPSKRHDEGYFETVKQALSEQKMVAGVKVTPATGSVLVFHTATPEAVASKAEKAGLFLVSPDALEETHAHHFGGLPQDLQRLLPPLLIVIAVIQLLRGRAAGPASTFLMMALNTMMSGRSQDGLGNWTPD
jgi:hypothetical protein